MTPRSRPQLAPSRRYDGYRASSHLVHPPTISILAASTPHAWSCARTAATRSIHVLPPSRRASTPGAGTARRILIGHVLAHIEAARPDRRADRGNHVERTSTHGRQRARNDTGHNTSPPCMDGRRPARDSVSHEHRQAVGHPDRPHVSTGKDDGVRRLGLEGVWRARGDDHVRAVHLSDHVDAGRG